MSRSFFSSGDIGSLGNGDIVADRQRLMKLNGASWADAQAKLLQWQRDYNEVRPHSSLGQMPPREFVAAWQLTRTARGEILNLETV